MIRPIPQSALLGCMHDVDTIPPEDSDIAEGAHLLEVLQDVAAKELGADYVYAPDEDPIDYIDTTGLQVTTIPIDSLLAMAMGDFFGAQLTTDDPKTLKIWEKNVRSMVADKKTGLIYFAHSTGYDWVDADLLGGNGDGSKRKIFEQGITISTNFNNKK